MCIVCNIHCNTRPYIQGNHGIQASHLTHLLKSDIKYNGFVTY